MPTLQDVARAAGVSLATASRALQGGTCAAATRAKVRAAAEAVGWVPDPGLASLVSRRWQRCAGMSLLGFVHQRDPSPSLVTGWEFTRAALVAGGRTAGWNVVDLPCDSGDATELLQTARTLGVRGLAAGLLHGDPARLDQLWDAMPAVALGTGSLVPPIPLVGSNLWGRYQSMWQAIYDAGWRRIGVALPAWDDSPSVRLRRGALLERWHTLDPADRIPFLDYPPDDPRPALAWAEQHRPGIVLAFDPKCAMALRQVGLHLPMVCLATYGPAPDAEWAGVWIDGQAIASAALSLLTTQLRSGLVGRQLAGLTHLIDMPYRDRGLMPMPGCVRT
jgi:DNA-binding LacI/PurR family transcriptional regulator